MIQPIARGLFVLLVLSVGASLARANDSAHVHVVLHPRGTTEAPVTFVDISVRGTTVPIRLIRRIEGTCLIMPELPGADAIVRVDCPTQTVAIRFDVARVHNEIVVTRNPPAIESDAGVSEPQIIARAPIATDTEVTVD